MYTLSFVINLDKINCTQIKSKTWPIYEFEELTLFDSMMHKTLQIFYSKTMDIK